MYAIIEIGGKQYKIHKDSKIKIEKLNIKKNSMFFINNILLFSDEEKVFLINNFFLKKIFIMCRIVKHGKHEKVNIFKMKRRKHYKKFKTHRQIYTEILIENFNLNFLEKIKNLYGS